MSTGFDKADVDAMSLTPGAHEHEHEHAPPDVAAPDADRAGGGSGRLATMIETVVLYVACIAAALALSAVLVTVTDGDAAAVFAALLDGSVRGPGRIGVTIGVAIPLLLVALGTIVATRAGLVNIGQEGQLFLGAAFAAYVGTELAAPGPVVICALMVAGAVGGALWAGIAGVLKYRRNVPEVLTTLLLVTVGTQLVGYGLKNEWLLLSPAEGRANRQQISEQLAPDDRIPRMTLFGNVFPTSALLAIAMMVLVGVVLSATVWGFRVRMLGQNPRTAQRAGVAASRYGGAAMLISGGFAGLAGAAMLAGGDFGNYTLVPGFPSNIGWTGLLVALVARQRVAAALVAAVVFASLRTGSGFLAATGVERRITDVVQGLLVLALLIPPALLFLRARRREIAAAGDRA
ncbi:ABC transporter permease [Ilumatobacter sp.]|uniref:ABC transporter permease n=1 Tax=Ilumatobacter sp. TaxID=1967498 RepID=UPI003B52D17F